MTEFVLIVLFMAATVAALISLSDSLVRGRRAYLQLKTASPKLHEAHFTILADRVPANVAAIARANTFQIAQPVQYYPKLSGQNDLLASAAAA